MRSTIGTTVKKNDKLGGFLRGNPLAKIVIIVDSHSTQDGQVVTKVDSSSVSSDIMGQVRFPSVWVNCELTEYALRSS